MDLSIDSEDQQGGLTARITYYTSNPGQFRCGGYVRSDNVFHLDCTEIVDGHMIQLDGNVQQDGSISGTDSLGGRWLVR
jgi:hypothetical protein